LEGVSGNDAANKRKAGFLDGIKEYKNIKVVASQVANWNRDQAYTKFQNILLANKNLKAVFACNDEMALGAYSAIVQQKISKENIVLVGFDAIPEAVEAVNAKKMDATIAQQPSLMGAKALIYARDIINDKKVDKMFPSELKLILKR
jgi:ribose transport system substrate-binding protein